MSVGLLNGKQPKVKQQKRQLKHYWITMRSQPQCRKTHGTDMSKPVGKAWRRTFIPISTCFPDTCWTSLLVTSSLSPKTSKSPPSQALESGLPMPARRSGVSARRHGRFCNCKGNMKFLDSVQSKCTLYGYHDTFADVKA
jgi:hypothetical protein